MTADLSLTLRSDPALLCSVRRLVRQYLLDHGVNEDKTGEVVLAIDEACTNTIRHAYENRHNETYEMVLSSGRDWIEVSVHDRGRTAPAFAVARKKAVAARDAREITPGGLGVQLIYEVFDEVSFGVAEPHGNCVLMRLRRPKSAEG